MKYHLTPDTPRPLASCRAGAVGDARWREVPDRVRHINRMRVHDAQMDARDSSKPGWR